MTAEPTAQDTDPAGGTQEAAEQTGNSAVDEVLASLDALDMAPVSEHVAGFESAHERLRVALSGADETSV